MNKKLVAQILVALSIIYGLAVAILAVLKVSALSTIVVIGAILLGGCWALLGVFGSRGKSRQS